MMAVQPDDEEFTFDIFHQSKFSSSAPGADKNMVFECENNFYSCQSARILILYELNKSFLFVASDANKVQECSLSVSQTSEFDTDGFFFRSHLQLCVYFTRLNINSKSLFCQKTRRRPAELSSGPINFCLTDEFLELEETGSNTFAEILSKIEERAFREGLEDCVKCQDALQATDWQSQKGESKSESDLAPRSSTRRGRLSAFQSLLAHDKWCWMRSVKRREIRNTELPTENEQFVCKINLWPREIECRGFVAAPSSMVLKGDVACGC